MKIWILAVTVAIVGLIAFASIAVVNAVQNEKVQIEQTPSCSSNGGNSCNAETNCGKATCGTISGTSSCGCR
jgi:hypothetical protein